MKSFITFLLALALTVNVGVQASSFLRHASLAANSTSTRSLANDQTSTRSLNNENNGEYGFVVSHIRKTNPWCLTVAYGSNEFATLGFRRCQFDNAPDNQLWKLDANGKLHTRVDHTKCMTLNHGDELFDGVRARLAGCDMETSLNKFRFEQHGKTGSFLKLIANPAYCITNRGQTPNADDTIHAKPCIKRHDYKWTYQPIN
jgi:hypothetical protein